MRRGKPYQGVSRCGVSRRICATCYLPTSFSTRWTGAAELRRRFLVYPDSRVPAHRQTYLCARMRRNNFPHDNTRVPRRSAFWPKPQKAPKALFAPAPGGFRLTVSPTAPNQLRENSFLLIRTGYGLRPYPASFGKAETLHPRKAAFYADMGGCGFPASAGLARVNRPQTECPINIARR